MVNTKVTDEVTDGVVAPEIHDPGMRNFGECHDGTQRMYILWDGTNRQDWAFTYTSSQRAFENGEPGSTMTLALKSTFKGFAMDFTDTSLISHEGERLISWTGTDSGNCYLHKRD